MIIVKMQAENIKKLKAVSIDAGAEPVVIGGKNGAGKSSVLDAIMYALRGRASLCDQPIRHGEAKALSHLEFGDYVVDLSITAAGSSLVVKDKKTGARFPSPQAMLDRLIGDLSFDPLAFAMMKPGEQAETLKRISGINLDAIESERRTIFDRRTEVGRDLKRAAGHAESLGSPENVPDQEVKTADILAELKAARTHNEAIEEEKKRLKDTGIGFGLLKENCERIERQIEELSARLKEGRTEMVKMTERYKALESLIASKVPLDESAIEAKLSEVEKINAKVRKNAEITKAVAHARTLKDQYESLSEEISALDAKREQALASAKMPLPGLSFDSGAVTYQGVPFSQISSAEQLRVSVAIGMSLNPKLRVIFVRNGSLLDEDNMKIIRDLAKDNDYQLWIETVGVNSDVTVVIEDGEIAGKKE